MTEHKRCFVIKINDEIIYNTYKVLTSPTELIVSSIASVKDYKKWDRRKSEKFTIELVSVDGEILSSHSVYLSFVGVEIDHHRFDTLILSLYFYYD